MTHVWALTIEAKKNDEGLNHVHQQYILRKTDCVFYDIWDIISIYNRYYALNEFLIMKQTCTNFYKHSKCRLGVEMLRFTLLNDSKTAIKIIASLLYLFHLQYFVFTLRKSLISDILVSTIYQKHFKPCLLFDF